MIPSILGFLALITGAVAQCNTAVNWIHSDEHCYYISEPNDLQNYTAALHTCRQLGSYLLSLTSPEETDFIIFDMLDCKQEGDCNLYDPKYLFWIGLGKYTRTPQDTITRRRGGWAWQSGEMYSWQNWYPEHPGPDIKHGMLYYTGQWAGKTANDQLRYICERKINSSSFPGIDGPTTDWYSPSSPPAANMIVPAVFSDQTMSIVIISASVGLPILLVVMVVTIVIYQKERRKLNNIRQQGPECLASPYTDPCDNQEPGPSGVTSERQNSENKLQMPANDMNPHDRIGNSSQMAAPVSDEYEELGDISMSSNPSINIYQGIAPV